MPRIQFEWMRGHSEASRAGWETRWERAWERGEERSLGPAGQKYLEDKYGAVVTGEEPPDDYYDEFDDPFDIKEDY